MEQSQAAVGQHNLRKRKAEAVVPVVEIETNEIKNDTRKQRICPLDGCFAVSKNIGEHLRSKKHKILPTGETAKQYKRLLKEAGYFDQSLVPATPQVSPRRQCGIISKEVLFFWI